MPEEGCLVKEDDAIAFSLLWQICRLMEKLTAHIGCDEKESWEHANQSIYEIGITLEERLMYPVDYTPFNSILKHYYDNPIVHRFRRFH